MLMRRLAGAGVAGAVALLLAVGFSLICSDARVSAQPVVLAPRDTVTYTSQIRWPEKDAIITQTEPLIVSGIAWTSDVEPPYLVDDPHLTTQKVDNYNYYVGWTAVVSAENYILQEATQPDFSDQTVTYCPATECLNKDLVGAHVQKANSSDNKWYIYPLCSAHNQSTGVLEVSDSYKLVSANKKETCEK